MIFLRQKHYGNNSRSLSRHHRRVAHNSSRNINRNHHSHNSNRTNSRVLDRSHSSPTVIPLNSQHPNSLNNLSRRPNLTGSISSLDFLRSITINERLASIGGLFGALSIIITGALLYAIFTAKSTDKW